ncbi:hypothetical protein GCM10010271_17880 [Streptomyces kurssanovii]|nr:hypothetical protein GCM10010271_17880 [Streptomyces kurssanovii]
MAGRRYLGAESASRHSLTGMDADSPEVVKMSEVVLRLSLRDMVHTDLEACRGWAGSDHLAGVAGQLDRARVGEADYLVVCTSTDVPVAKGGIDYQVRQDAGFLWKLTVHPALRSCGVGTL